LGRASRGGLSAQPRRAAVPRPPTVLDLTRLVTTRLDQPAAGMLDLTRLVTTSLVQLDQPAAGMLVQLDQPGWLIGSYRGLV